MALSRNVQITGGANVTFDGVSFFVKDTINVKISLATFEVPNQVGVPDERLQQRIAEITFTPHGKFINSYIAVLYALLSKKPGDLIYPDTDKNLVIEPLNYSSQSKWTFNACAVTKMPNMTLGLTKTILGEVGITAIGITEDTVKSSTDDDNRLFKRESASAPTVSDFDESKAVTEAYTAAYGAVATGIVTEDGFDIAFDCDLVDRQADGFAVLNKMVGDKGPRVTATAKPINVTETQLTTMLSAHVALGGRMTDYADLTISNSGGSRSVVIYNARVTEASPVWAVAEHRIGSLAWRSMPKYSAGVLQPPAAITAPVS